MHCWLLAQASWEPWAAFGSIAVTIVIALIAFANRVERVETIVEFHEKDLDDLKDHCFPGREREPTDQRIYKYKRRRG